MRQETDDLSQIVARKIFGAIMSGHFPEGSILPNEHSLGETLGVSRTALREAIKGLSSKGMLETRRRRGTQVTDRSQWTLIDCEVIGWTRKDGGGGVSDELWQGLAIVMPDLARLAASRQDRPHRAPELSAEVTTVPDLVSFLAGLAPLSGNRFLSSFATISLISLARDDASFLESRLSALPDGLVQRLCREIASGDGAAAARSMTELFAGTGTPAAPRAAALVP